jgi:hypothetical protein
MERARRSTLALAAYQRLWDPAGDHRLKRAQVLGIILAPLGLILVFFGGIMAGRWDWV